jgi:hypothetical protein
VAVARQLVDYGADGIYLDSSGWQWNWPMMNSVMSLSGDRCTPWEYSRAVLELADQVRDAIGPDRVVLCESTSGQLGRQVHGGFSSDLGQKVAQQRWRNQGRILASPVRYGMPQVNFISNGLDMNELHQIFAAGHPLALCWNLHSYADNPKREGPDVFMHRKAERDQIKQLLTVRNSLKNALVYCRQTYQPDTGDDDVAAYFYGNDSKRSHRCQHVHYQVLFGPLAAPTERSQQSLVQRVGRSDDLAAQKERQRRTAALSSGCGRLGRLLDGAVTKPAASALSKPH